MGSHSAYPEGRVDGYRRFSLAGEVEGTGYLEGRADGHFNQDTEEAVKKFQFNKGLKVTGVADKEDNQSFGALDIDYQEKFH